MNWNEEARGQVRAEQSLPDPERTGTDEDDEERLSKIRKKFKARSSSPSAKNVV